MPDSKVLGAAGLLGAVLFPLVVAVLTAVQWSFLRARGWDAIQSSDVPYPSTLALSPDGWLQVLNFAILGLALVSVGAGLWRALDPAPVAAIGLLVVAGVASFALMAPTDGSLSSVSTWQGAVHFGAFFVLLIAIVLSAVLLGLGVSDLPAWVGLRVPSIAATVVAVLLTLVSFAVPAVGGVASILSVVALLAWLGLVAVTLVSA